MTEIKNKFYNETIYKEELENGLTVYLCPKEEYIQFSAMFVTNFGSFDTKFTPLGEEENITVPEGVAHFLEHKMFETLDGEDVMKKFSSLGVNVNAFTSYDRTAYTVAGTDNINESIELLLDFVQEPAFTEESVNKEKSIIEQEILMYSDKPKNFARSNLLKNLYGENDMIWREIGGTPESIKEINKDILLKSYNKFYHPSNMALVVSGGFNPVELMEVIRKNQNKKSFLKTSPYKREISKFDPKVEKASEEGHFNIQTPIAYWAVKYPYIENNQSLNLKMNFAIDFLIDSNFSSFSSFNEDMRKNGLGEITVNYSASYYSGYGFLTVSGTTNKYQKLFDFINMKFDEIFTKPIDEEKLKIWKRGCHTNNIKTFNSVSKISNYLADFHFTNQDLFDFIDAPSQITIDDVNEALKVLKQSVRTSYVLLPNNK